MEDIRTGLKAVEETIKRVIGYINDELLLNDNTQVEGDKNLSLVKLVEKAHREWQQAKSLFEEVGDPDLVDHAIFAMEAAEKKYIYLLKQAKKEKVVDENFYHLQEKGLA